MKGLITQSRGNNNAVFSECGAYRYSLTWSLDRTIFSDGRRVCVFIMLNPSTATAFKLDPTLTRCKGFAEREGSRWMHIVNLFAYRATKPSDMKAQSDPIGKHNDGAIHNALEWVKRTNGTLICGWGSHGAHMQRSQHVRDIIRAAGVVPQCLKLIKNDEPGHPLYLPADAPLVELPNDPKVNDINCELEVV